MPFALPSFLSRRPVVKPTNVLMVCLGNICRSPTAEAVLRTKLLRAGLDAQVGVASAGTHGERGRPPDARAAAAAARRGYDLSGIRSRRLIDQDFDRFDLVLAMDLDNLEVLMSRCPADQQRRVGLLLPFAPGAAAQAEVPDPYYGGPAGFDRVLDLIEPACEGLLANLQRQLAGTS
ncbi:low molecular weight protein-tyrosine-phosphatase [Aquabacterium sp.]|uniref:low molecular weight protein-tyrosine-phosphatase n=1 Tax=Aquabacterium sp. TaxID=1872578 RepID=UPI0037852F67